MHLIKRCLDANPLNRPTASEVKKILDPWYFDFDDANEQIELKKQIKEAEEIYNNPSTSTPSTSLGLSYEHIQKLFIHVDYLNLIIFLNQKILMIITNEMTI